MRASQEAPLAKAVHKYRRPEDCIQVAAKQACPSQPISHIQQLSKPAQLVSSDTCGQEQSPNEDIDAFIGTTTASRVRRQARHQQT
eukprot:2498935-Pleurochrysis_carterae.AAC.1